MESQLKWVHLYCKILALAKADAKGKPVGELGHAHGKVQGVPVRMSYNPVNGLAVLYIEDKDYTTPGTAITALEERFGVPYVGLAQPKNSYSGRG